MDKDEYVSYTLVITAATANTVAETATIKIKKFYGGSPRDWLKWSSQFRSLARKKQWTDEQKAHNLVALIEGDIEAEVEVAAREAVTSRKSFEEFFTDVGLLSVPPDFSEDLDNELWTMTKRRDETVLKFSQRLKENIRMFAELPQNAEEVPEVQQCRYFKRGMPRGWQDKLASAGVVHDTLGELVLYFSRLEKAEREQSTRNKSKGISGGSRNKDQRRDKNQGQSQKSFRKDYKKRSNGEGAKAKSDMWCTFHKTGSHNTSDCYTLKKKEEHKIADTKSETTNKKKHYPRIHKDFESDWDSDENEIKFVDLLETKARPTSAPLRIPVKLRRGGQTFEALLDSGASKSIINGRTLGANTELGRKFIPASPTVFETMNGSVTSSGSTMVQFVFSKLKSESVITHRFEVIKDSKDAMVIGRDLMSALGLILNFKDKVVQWDECSLSLNTGQSATDEAVDAKKDHEFSDESKEVANGSIKPEQLLPDELNGQLSQRYLELLVQYRKLYDGHLGRMRFDDYEIPITPDYKPVHAKPYTVARSHEAKAREKIQQLITADVLEQIYDSEVAAPAFFLVKPDGSLRLLVDYRWLNKFLRRSPYYVPRIREVLMRLSKAKCISTFDANLGYYARRLASKSRPFTAFCLPWGKFQYKRLPMGISTAPDEYQACMERIFGDLEFVVVYLDDILVFSASAEEHLEHLHIVFKRLATFGVSLNGKKCHVLRKEVDYLGYTLSAEGVRPQAKKIQAIQRIAVPSSRKELRRFLGMINYYRDMVPNKTTLCKPLHRLTSSKVPFTWLSSDTEAFRAIQRAFAEAVLLSFPDFEKPFDVYADASGTQLGGLIMQGVKILACYSRSLNKHQLNYTTMELELLSVVELLKEYRTMLLGFPVVVHTDHKNLIFPTETSLRVKRWKLLLSEYRMTMHYIKGVKNVGADAFSRMRFAIGNDAALVDEIYATNERTECVMDGPVIREHQEADDMVQKIKAACLAGTNNPDYQLIRLLGCTLVAYQKRVIAPDSLRDDMIAWYHQNLGHPAGERQFKTMRHTFYWPNMETSIVKFVKKCTTCKRAKLHGGKQDFGLLPPRSMRTVNPFDVVHVDLIGPYEGGSYGITIVDQATRWLEVGVQQDKRALTTAESFDREWLCRYPRPRKVIHDQGSEFTGEEFQELLRSYGIKAKPITTKNPQANAICERVHLEIQNVIRCHEGVDWKKVIYYAAFAVRASYHSILNASPGQLIFGQDMISRQLHDANWSYMSKRRFEAILADNDRENDKRIENFYQPGDQVMIRVPKQFRVKTKRIADGPFPILTVHDNGTVTVDKGASQQQVSIRRIFPC